MTIAEYHQEKNLLIFILKPGVSGFYSRSLDYLASSSWLSKQYWVWVPSHGVDLRSNQTLIDYSYKFCECHYPSIFYRQGRLQVKGFVSGLGPMFVFQQPKEYLLTPYVLDTSSTTLCSVNCMNAVLLNGIPLSVRREQPVVLAIACVVWGVPQDPLHQELNQVLPSPVNGSFAWPQEMARLCIPPSLGDLIRITFIHSMKFSPHRVSTPLLKCVPNSSHLSQHSLFKLHLDPHTAYSPIPFPTHPKSAHKIS